MPSDPFTSADRRKVDQFTDEAPVARPDRNAGLELAPKASRRDEAEARISPRQRWPCPAIQLLECPRRGPERHGEIVRVSVERMPASLNQPGTSPDD